MGSAPWHYCSPSCPTKVQRGRCPQHTIDRTTGGWRQPGKRAPKRIEGRRLRPLRERLFADEPFCRMCKTAVAEIRDHIIPLSEGGTEDSENIQPVCRPCSDRKTAAEAQRAKRRGGW